MNKKEFLEYVEKLPDDVFINLTSFEGIGSEGIVNVCGEPISTKPLKIDRSEVVIINIIHKTDVATNNQKE